MSSAPMWAPTQPSLLFHPGRSSVRSHLSPPRLNTFGMVPSIRKRSENPPASVPLGHSGARGPAPSRATREGVRMADRVLFISWGSPVHGREEHGLEVFNEALGMYGRMQQDGRIEGFDVTLLDPN